MSETKAHVNFSLKGTIWVESHQLLSPKFSLLVAGLCQVHHTAIKVRKRQQQKESPWQQFRGVQRGLVLGCPCCPACSVLFGSQPPSPGSTKGTWMCVCPAAGNVLIKLHEEDSQWLGMSITALL